MFEKSDVHIHVPAGAIPKDGPSAGVAMFMALVSMLTGRTTRNDTAMSGLALVYSPTRRRKLMAVSAAQSGAGYAASMFPRHQEVGSMRTSSGPVIERMRVREATGVFRARGDLEAAVSALLLAGFDRADIDILADAETVRQRLRTTYVAREEMADVPYAPRRAFMAREDVALAVAGVGGILIYIGATLTALGVIASGGALGWATAAAAVIAAAGGIGASVITRFLERQQLEELESAALTGGLVLWVRVRSPEREERALKILREHGGEAVRIHEVDIEKRTEDLPLSSLRPDPWLSNERLGQP